MRQHRQYYLCRCATTSMTWTPVSASTHATRRAGPGHRGDKRMETSRGMTRRMPAAQWIPACAGMTTVGARDDKLVVCPQKKSPKRGIFLIIDFCVFTETFVSITAGYCAFADEITLGMQARRAYLWCFGANVPHATVRATPHNNFILFE